MFEGKSDYMTAEWLFGKLSEVNSATNGETECAREKAFFLDYS